MQAGDFLPIYLQLGDSLPGKFPRAYVRDSADVLIATVDLNDIGLGFYSNYSAVQMPNQNYVTVQIKVFSDSGHTTPAIGESITVKTYLLDGHPVAGDPIPAYVQMFDGATNKFPRATIRDAVGNLLGGSPVNMTHVATGLYKNNAVGMTASKFITAQYIVYDDSGHTVLSTTETSASDQFFYGQRQPNPAILYVPATIVGTIETDLLPVNGEQDLIVRNSDRTLVVRMVRNDNQEPFDLSGVSSTEFRFLNDDGTVLSIKSTDIGAPSGVLVALAGKLYCNLTKAQTNLLMVQKPAQFSIVLNGIDGQLIVTMPNQLVISEEFP